MSVIRRLTFLILLPVLLCFWTAIAAAQSQTSGDITGVVMDATGAVVPGATITLRNDATGAVATTASNNQGSYRFSLLLPGSYTLSVAATGFQTTSRNVPVSVGQAATLDFHLAIGTATQTVTVTSEAAVVQADNGNISTTYSAQQLAQVPTGGGDITYITQTSPGAVMNTQGGYGNVEMFGLPATSNLFKINGQDNNDPFLNLSNSGATNLTLGQNELQQVTVVNNGYSGQYGRAAGADIDYVTQQGSNQFHGNAVYYWNGRTMNANNFFNNASATKRPFDNANQWAWSLGGPILHDKTFFFVDQEGLRVVLPTNLSVNLPSPQFQAATLANLATVSPASVPFYQTMFNLYNNAPGAAGAANTLPGGGCGSFSAPGLAAGSPCAIVFRSTAGNRSQEWILATRVDQRLGSTDTLFGRFQTDHGSQPTFTDPINSAFNAISTQPEYQGQVQENHAFGADAVNQFIAAVQWYGALFGPKNLTQSLAIFPTTLSFSGSAFQTLGGENSIFPQGRNVTQYQFVDDYSTTFGNHTFKVGADYRRNLVSDHDFGRRQSGLARSSLANFFNGKVTSFQQSFASLLVQRIKLYDLGGYAQDEWRVVPSLRLTLALRVDHNSNPVCGRNCFADLTLPFDRLTHDATVPYNAAIRTGVHRAFTDYTRYSWQPRLGFAWRPFGRTDTVLRGGVGLFTDTFPATIVDSVARNVPLYNLFTVRGQPLSPAAPGNIFTSASSANASFINGFGSGGTLASISASNPSFVPPGFFSMDPRVRLPQFQEWNLELQQGLGAKSAVSVNYVGNHGVHIPVLNNILNAYCPLTTCATGFAGLPPAAPDPRFGTVTQLQPAGVSNYNGLVVSLKRKFSQGFQLQANYTYSHALDDVSNGGILPFNFGTNLSVLSPQDPHNLRRYNYGNADYDVRHSLNLNYVWEVPFRSVVQFGPDQLWRGWVVAGTLFSRNGLPYTVTSSDVSSTLAPFNYGGTVFANWLGGSGRVPCTVQSPCVNAAQFSSPVAGFGNQRRNQFRGPRFFDSDLSVVKNTQLPRWEKAQLGVGVEAFNLFNHPNFDQPVQDFSDPQFGQVISTVSVPTSILGSFLGGDSSPRIVQVTARLTF